MIIKDLNMPVMDGYEAVICLRKFQVEKNIRAFSSIIACTAYSDTNSINKWYTFYYQL